MFDQWKITKVEGSSVWLEHPPVPRVLPDGIKLEARAGHTEEDWHDCDKGRIHKQVKTLSLRILDLETGEWLNGYGSKPEPNAPRIAGRLTVRGAISVKDHDSLPGSFTGMNLNYGESYYKRGDCGVEVTDTQRAAIYKLAKSAGDYVLANDRRIWRVANIQEAERHLARAEEALSKAKVAHAAAKAAVAEAKKSKVS